MVEGLLPTAANLVMLVHGDGGPREVREVLARLDAAQKEALLVVLAGLVDPDQPMGAALGWLDYDERGETVVPAWEDRTTLRTMAAETEATADAAAGVGEEVDEVAVQRFVSGFPVNLSEAEYLAAIQACASKGMSYRNIDHLRRVPARTTENLVSRLRKQYTRSGRPFPTMARPDEGRKFTEAEVVDIRKRSAAGRVTDMELGLAYGVDRSAIGAICRGDRYPQFGGPIRGARPNRPGEATRVVWAGGKAGFAAAG